MKLKNRILISNTLTITLCLVMLLLVFNGVTNTFRKKYISEIIESEPIVRERQVPPQDDKTKDINLKIKQKELESFYLISTICVGISVVVIVLVSQIFTRKIFKRIIKPVEKLIEANERIKAGNYSELIEYEGEYEFEQLCASFNNMQLTLKDEKERESEWQKTKQDMISGISHDLKTPLTSIKGYIKGIKDGVADSKEKQEKYLDVAYKKASEMDTLIERLLYFSRVENGQISYDMRNVSLKKMIEQYIKGQEFEFKERGIKITSKIETASVVNVDIMQINRVFDNIIQNSIKYASVPNLEIEINAYNEGDKVKIGIKDNGVGISNEKLEKIFDEFYRGDESRTSSSIEGSGIGLYVCKYIIERHRGNITAINDNGLKIIITLPRGDEEFE
ncbi:MAG: HAMP domain-containing histidine kinase [Bacilli bacterium]|nr:HAMP domain-containing histidine kinase [Bacilli bacterium]